jgi:diguanylate cyclase (GGDEF)-like protein
MAFATSKQSVLGLPLLEDLTLKEVDDLIMQPLEQLEESQNLLEQVESLLKEAWGQIHIANFDNAEHLALQVGTLLNDNEKQHLAKLSNLLGVIGGERGQLTTALEHFLGAYGLFEACADSFGAADALGNAALIYTYLGDYNNALELHLKTLALHEAIPNPAGISRTLSGLGLAYIEMGQPQEGLKHLLRSLELEATKAVPQSNALGHMNVGRAYLMLNDIESALFFTRASVEQLERCGDRSGLAYALDTLGSIYQTRAEVAESHRYFERALAIKADLGDRLGQAITRWQQSRLLIQEAQFHQAVEVLQKALEDAKDAGGKSEIYKIHLALADAFEGMGNYSEALKHHRDFATVKDDVFNEISNRTLQSLRVTFDVQRTEKEHEIFRLKNVELAAANKQKEELLKQLERQAHEDALTGLFNRRYFDIRLAEVFEQAQRENSNLSLLICDIDHFKQINDGFSHQVGDQVLTTIGKLFKQGFRQGDIVARYGGEEFVMLIPDLSLNYSLALCERLRQSIETYPWHNIAADLKVTISGGLSNDLNVASGEKMLIEADSLLYQAKRSGRNRILVRNL